ncbi:hypothetical protein BLNAU_18501 [Blattamonas nauphoetae]|uniref:Uncharacterized protein n=1 Tax=Blattamonas nauphoetae TaxID=2049346 RepID=A0ABQ9X4R2_9EUKA|nr:hypothetical protein BLNAU_18501 [Blattamonas nauphoetae]
MGPRENPEVADAIEIISKSKYLRCAVLFNRFRSFYLAFAVHTDFPRPDAISRPFVQRIIICAHITFVICILSRGDSHKNPPPFELVGGYEDDLLASPVGSDSRKYRDPFDMDDTPSKEVHHLTPTFQSAQDGAEAHSAIFSQKNLSKPSSFGQSAECLSSNRSSPPPDTVVSRDAVNAFQAPSGKTNSETDDYLPMGFQNHPNPFYTSPPGQTFQPFFPGDQKSTVGSAELYQIPSTTSLGNGVSNAALAPVHTPAKLASSPKPLNSPKKGLTRVNQSLQSLTSDLNDKDRDPFDNDPESSFPPVSPPTPHSPKSFVPPATPNTPHSPKSSNTFPHEHKEKLDDLFSLPNQSKLVRQSTFSHQAALSSKLTSHRLSAAAFGLLGGQHKHRQSIHQLPSGFTSQRSYQGGPEDVESKYQTEKKKVLAGFQSTAQIQKSFSRSTLLPQSVAMGSFYQATFKPISDVSVAGTLSQANFPALNTSLPPVGTPRVLALSGLDTVSLFAFVGELMAEEQKDRKDARKSENLRRSSFVMTPTRVHSVFQKDPDQLTLQTVTSQALWEASRPYDYPLPSVSTPVTPESPHSSHQRAWENDQFGRRESVSSSVAPFQMVGGISMSPPPPISHHHNAFLPTKNLKLPPTQIRLLFSLCSSQYPSVCHAALGVMFALIKDATIERTEEIVNLGLLRNIHSVMKNLTKSLLNPANPKPADSLLMFVPSVQVLTGNTTVPPITPISPTQPPFISPPTFMEDPNTPLTNTQQNDRANEQALIRHSFVLCLDILLIVAERGAMSSTLFNLFLSYSESEGLLPFLSSIMNNQLCSLDVKGMSTVSFVFLHKMKPLDRNSTTDAVGLLFMELIAAQARQVEIDESRYHISRDWQAVLQYSGSRGDISRDNKWDDWDKSDTEHNLLGTRNGISNASTVFGTGPFVCEEDFWNENSMFEQVEEFSFGKYFEQSVFTVPSRLGHDFCVWRMEREGWGMGNWRKTQILAEALSVISPEVDVLFSPINFDVLLFCTLSTFCRLSPLSLFFPFVFSFIRDVTLTTTRTKVDKSIVIQQKVDETRMNSLSNETIILLFSSLLSALTHDCWRDSVRKEKQVEEAKILDKPRSPHDESTSMTSAFTDDDNISEALSQYSSRAVHDADLGVDGFQSDTGSFDGLDEETRIVVVSREVILSTINTLLDGCENCKLMDCAEQAGLAPKLCKFASDIITSPFERDGNGCACGTSLLMKDENGISLTLAFLTVLNTIAKSSRASLLIDSSTDNMTKPQLLTSVPSSMAASLASLSSLSSLTPLSPYSSLSLPPTRVSSFLQSSRSKVGGQCGCSTEPTCLLLSLLHISFQTSTINLPPHKLHHDPYTLCDDTLSNLRWGCKRSSHLHLSEITTEALKIVSEVFSRCVKRTLADGNSYLDVKNYTLLLRCLEVSGASSLVAIDDVSCSLHLNSCMFVDEIPDGRLSQLGGKNVREGIEHWTGFFRTGELSEEALEEQELLADLEEADVFEF